MIELKNVPKKIYLQMTETEMFGDFLEHDVTWSEDRINDSDIEYVRVQPDHVKMQMLEALRVQVDDIDRWRKTGIPAGPEESRAIYNIMKQAIEAAEKENE